jgi:DNA-binding beta-propeller fold protein YncE
MSSPGIGWQQCAKLSTPRLGKPAARNRATRRRTTLYATTGSGLLLTLALGIGAMAESPRSLISQNEYFEAKHGLDAQARLALASGTNRVVVVDVATSTETAAVMCGLTPCTYVYSGGLAFNAAGTRAYVIDFQANTLSTINTDRLSPLYLQELSRVPVFAEQGENAWQVAVRQDRAIVAVMGFPGHVISFDISADIPVAISLDPVGTYAYEFDIWTRPTSEADCKNLGWTTLGGYKNQGNCLNFAAD